MNLLRLSFILIISAALLTACDPPSPQKRADAEWLPDRTYRARDTKWLPPSSQVDADHKLWSQAHTNDVALIYMARFNDPSRQSEFAVEYKRMSSPVGNPWWTYASYRYTDPTNGSYIIRFRKLGRHDTQFLKLDSTPRLHWLLADDMHVEGGIPVLDVIEIEGVTKFSAY